MVEFIRQPWPWYVAGPLIGLTVPLLLIWGTNLLASVHLCAISGQPACQLVFHSLSMNGKKNHGTCF